MEEGDEGEELGWSVPSVWPNGTSIGLNGASVRLNGTGVGLDGASVGLNGAGVWHRETGKELGKTLRPFQKGGVSSTEVWELWKGGMEEPRKGSDAMR